MGDRGTLVTLLACLGACGRIGFDPHGDGSAVDDSDVTVNGDTAAGYPGPFDQLMLWYPMDGDPAGGASDASGKQRNAACGTTQCPNSVVGRIGMAFDLTTGVYLRVPDDPALDALSAFTIAYWASLRVNNTDGIAKAVGTASGDSFELGTTVNGILTLCTTPGISSAAVCDNATAGAVPLNQWVHFAATWDGAAVKLFIDGMEVRNASPRMTVFDAHDILIGAEETPGASSIDFFLDGSLDDVRIYSRALSPSEITGLAMP